MAILFMYKILSRNTTICDMCKQRKNGIELDKIVVETDSHPFLYFQNKYRYIPRCIQIQMRDKCLFVQFETIISYNSNNKIGKDGYLVHTQNFIQEYDYM
jgi:hypothetical protein